MPQIMPLIWIFTLIFLSILIFILISFIYFFILPPSNLFCKANNNIIQHQYIINLFSIFDPITSSNLSLNWFSIFIFLFILPYQFWLLPSRITYLWNLFINYIFNEFKILINYSFSNIIIFIRLLFLFFNNFLGLFLFLTLYLH